MRCGSCGKEIADGSIFCNFCGGRQTATPSDEASEAPKDLKMFCRTCRQEFDEDWIFCDRCGMRLVPMTPENTKTEFTMRVDDCFAITGRGTAVVGEVLTGQLRVGDIVILSGRDCPVIGLAEEKEKTTAVSEGKKISFLTTCMPEWVSKGSVIRKREAAPGDDGSTRTWMMKIGNAALYRGDRASGKPVFSGTLRILPDRIEGENRYTSSGDTLLTISGMKRAVRSSYMAFLPAITIVMKNGEMFTIFSATSGLTDINRAVALINQSICSIADK